MVGNTFQELTGVTSVVSITTRRASHARVKDYEHFETAVSVTSTEGANNATETATATIPVSITPVADNIQLTAADVVGVEDQGIGEKNTFALDLTAALQDTDGSEQVAAIKITGVPDEWTDWTAGTYLFR